LVQDSDRWDQGALQKHYQHTQIAMQIENWQIAADRRSCHEPLLRRP
jgi:hypothetical protein